MQEIEIEKEEQKLIVKCIRQNIDQTQTLKVPDKVNAKIIKYKRKKRAKTILIALQNQVRNRNDPIYIFLLIKLMKRYNLDEMERGSLYGYSDAGIGQVAQIKLDKIQETLDLSLETYSVGQMSYDYLIKLYRSYQDQDYYDLSLILQSYQEWAIKNFKFIKNSLGNLKSTSIQQELDDSHEAFVRATKQWLNENFYNDLFEVSLGSVNIQERRPIFTTKMFSKNLLMFIGQGFEETCQYVIDMNLKNAFSNIFDTFNSKGVEENEKLQISKLIKLLKSLMTSQQLFEIDDEIITLEGYSIPVKKVTTIHYYNYETQVIGNKPHFNSIILTTYNFEPQWIKYLINLRTNGISAEDQIKCAQNQLEKQSKIKYFDYYCQQEYFLEKFKYS